MICPLASDAGLRATCVKWDLMSLRVIEICGRSSDANDIANDGIYLLLIKFTNFIEELKIFKLG